jgi:hypothetical protein
MVFYSRIQARVPPALSLQSHLVRQFFSPTLFQTLTVLEYWSCIFRLSFNLGHSGVFSHYNVGVVDLGKDLQRTYPHMTSGYMTVSLLITGAVIWIYPLCQSVYDCCDKTPVIHKWEEIFIWLHVHLVPLLWAVAGQKKYFLLYSKYKVLQVILCVPRPSLRISLFSMFTGSFLFNNGIRIQGLLLGVTVSRLCQSTEPGNTCTFTNPGRTIPILFLCLSLC